MTALDLCLVPFQLMIALKTNDTSDIKIATTQTQNIRIIQ